MSGWYSIRQLTYRISSRQDRSSVGTAAVAVDSMWTLSVTGARTTLSNERWIRSDLINSAYALALRGSTPRNYFRADRVAEGRVALNIPRRAVARSADRDICRRTNGERRGLLGGALGNVVAHSASILGRSDVVAG